MDILGFIKKLFSGGTTLPINEIVSWVEQQNGLSSIIDKLKANGLSNIVESWLGKSKPLPISSDQLTNALGSGVIQQLADKIGGNAGVAGKLLSKALPSLVSSISSQGGDLSNIGADALKHGLTSLKSSLFK